MTTLFVFQQNNMDAVLAGPVGKVIAVLFFLLVLIVIRDMSRDPNVFIRKIVLPVVVIGLILGLLGWLPHFDENLNIIGFGDAIEFATLNNAIEAQND